MVHKLAISWGRRAHWLRSFFCQNPLDDRAQVLLVERKVMELALEWSQFQLDAWIVPSQSSKLNAPLLRPLPYQPWVDFILIWVSSHLLLYPSPLSGTLSLAQPEYLLFPMILWVQSSMDLLLRTRLTHAVPFFSDICDAWFTNTLETLVVGLKDDHIWFHWWLLSYILHLPASCSYQISLP